MTTQQEPMKLKFKKLHPEAVTPTKGTAGSNAYDLYAAEAPVVTENAEQLIYDTGIAMAIPEGFVGLVFPRSSICKTDLRLSNGVGVIDSDYRGSIKAVFDNIDTFTASAGVNAYEAGNRIGQILIVPSPAVTLEEVDALPETQRGTGGFGSTGK